MSQASRPPQPDNTTGLDDQQIFADRTQANADNVTPSASHASTDDSDRRAQDHTSYHATTFDFPTLDRNGSVEHLEDLSTRRYRTPPAAPSSLGARHRASMMAQSAMADSTPAFADDQYDMVDDLSEISTDDHEIVSLISTDDDTSDDSVLTPEETVVPSPQQEDDDTDRQEHVEEPMTLSEADSRSSYAAIRWRELKEENELFDSYMSEDMETPRQSTVRDMSSRCSREKRALMPPCHLPSRASPLKAAKSTQQENLIGRLISRPCSKSMALAVAGIAMLGLLIDILLFGYTSQYNMPSGDVVGRASARREALSSQFASITVETYVEKGPDAEHLVPQPVPTGTNVFGQTLYASQQDVRHDVVYPAHMVFSLPHLYTSTLKYREVKGTVSVQRGRIELNATQVKLADGIYAIALDPMDAYGFITYHGNMTNGDFTIRHDFGYDVWSHALLDHWRTDISKMAMKDLAAARKTAHDFKGFMQVECGAGAAATKNVAARLAGNITKDLQVLGTKALSVADKAAEVARSASWEIQRQMLWAEYYAGQAVDEVMALAEKAISSVGKMASWGKKSAKAAVPDTQRTVDSLKLAPERAMSLRRKFLEKTEATNAIDNKEDQFWRTFYRATEKSARENAAAIDTKED